ncbi:MAG TPA: hypothetical protein VFJ62_19475 [Usitatibacter sp.]|nr:hypothetical protein [Usitatibacter sp.]
MRNRIAAFAATLACALAHAQAPQGCDTPESHRLDFWLGEWKLTYTQNGKEGTSHNRITKTLDGCAVFEEFTGAPGVALQGRSMSMFDRISMRWKQVWVDNGGAWLDFVGEPAADGGMVFAREVARNGQRIMQRMVFSDVKPASLRWQWQRSLDGGATWATLWDIHYERVGKAAAGG